MSTIVSQAARRHRHAAIRGAPPARSLDGEIAARIAAERGERMWSLADLADRSGVSRAMVAKVERGDAKPTASLLGKLSAAFGLPLSAFFKRVEDPQDRVARGSEQPVWQDPGSGYIRRSLSPVSESALQLTQIRLPPGARVSFPAAAYTFVHQQIWVTAGTLTFHEGRTVHTLRSGDCLALGPPMDCTFANDTGRECRYVVATARR